MRVEGTANPVLDERGQVIGFIAIHREPKARSPSAATRNGSVEVAYRGIFEHSPIPTWVVDIETLRFLVVNDAAVSRYGYSREEFLQMTVADIRPPEDVARLKERMASPERARDELWRHRTKDGTELQVGITSQHFEMRGRKCAVVHVHDLTQQKRLEAQFLEAQKLEAVGRLAGSVAHDFNNLLSVIVGYAALAKESMAPGSALRGDIEEIEKASQRATALTGQLLAFSRRQVLEPRTVALDESIAALSKMLGRLLGEDIDLRVVPGSSLWPVRVDPGQIDQVLMNLAVNARDAMPSGGTLTIETTNLTREEAEAQGAQPPPLGPCVRISVTDTGGGMTPEILSHIFEPFYTTKEVGKGTGLGLATVRAIVNDCGGSLHVESRVGEGSRFDVYLPRCATPHAAPPLASAREPAPARTGTETVLVVEDDPLLRRLLDQVLRKQGYETLVASTPSEARRLASQHGGEVHLLLTDVVMPEMNGPKLATRLMVERPKLRVLYMSGYAGNVLTAQGIVDTGPAMLHKPVAPRELLRRVRDVLDEAHG